MASDGKQLCASKGEDDLVHVCVYLCVCVKTMKRQGSGPHFAQDKSERYSERRKGQTRERKTEQGKYTKYVFARMRQNRPLKWL